MMMNPVPCLLLWKLTFVKFGVFITFLIEIEFGLENGYLQGCFTTLNSVLCSNQDIVHTVLTAHCPYPG